MMKHASSVQLASAFLVLFSVLHTANAADAFVDMKFDDLDLKALPPGSEKSEASDSPLMTMIIEEGRGKVLKLVNKENKSPTLTVPLDVTKVAGKTLNVTTWSKFSGKYTPITDKPWARPKLYINAKDARGKSIHSLSLTPNPEKPEWQELKNSITIPTSAASVVAQFIIPEVECQVLFDGLIITLSDAPVVAAAPENPPAPAAPATPAVPATPATARPIVPQTVAPATPAPPAGDPNSPDALAAKAPRKTFDDGGMTFSPELAKLLQKSYPSKTANANTVMLVGSGIADKSALPKFGAPWHALPLSPKLTGATATPRNLLIALPEALLKEKPEVVFIASDPAPGRKPSSSESEDWDDICRLCARFGALPILVPHGQEGKDEQFEHIAQAVKKAADISSYVLVSPTPAEAFPKRMDNLLRLLDIHVFARVKAESVSGKPGTPNGKPVEE